MLKTVVASVGLAVLGACVAAKPPAALDRDARSFISLVLRRQFDSAIAMSQLGEGPDTVRVELGRLRDLLTLPPPTSVSFVRANVILVGDTTRGFLTYELSSHGRAVLVGVDVVRARRPGSVVAVRAYAESVPLSVTNEFSLRRRSGVHYAFLLLAALSGATCIAGAGVAAIRKMSFSWILFSLMGVCEGSVNWTTGYWQVNLFAVQLLGGGCSRVGQVGPWVISWSLPVGAIVVLFRSRSRRRTAAARGSDRGPPTGRPDGQGGTS